MGTEITVSSWTLYCKHQTDYGMLAYFFCTPEVWFGIPYFMASRTWERLIIKHKKMCSIRTTNLLSLVTNTQPSTIFTLGSYTWVAQGEKWPSALWRNVQIIRICMEEKTIVSVGYECKRLKLCVSSFLCGFRADLWPFNEQHPL